MKPTTDARRDRDDAHMTVEQIVERIRWLDATTLLDLHNEMAVAANRDRPSWLASFPIR